MSFKKLFKSVVVLLVMFTVLGCNDNSPAVPEKQQLMFNGFTMGPIVYTVKFVSNKDEIEQLDFAKKVDDLLVEINAKMSTYDPNSEVSIFNRSIADMPVPVSTELEFVLAESIRLANMTQGTLDISVGPLVNLWSFGPEKRVETVPSDDRIAETKRHIGIEKLILNKHQISKTDPKLYIDLSAIAKGYAVDRVAELLEQYGIVDYLVDIGGEMRVNGLKDDNTPWRVAIEKPDASTRAVQQVIIPGNHAVATSGDYRNYFEKDGIRYSHTIDPETGKPINHKLVSVTVIHASAMTADGLATAIEVMGPDVGFEFAKQHNLAVYLIEKTDDGFVELSTEQFQQFLAK